MSKFLFKSLINHPVSCTPGSMNSLFGDFFRKFGGVFLEVFGTISGGIWEEFGRFPEETRRNFLRNFRDFFGKNPGNFREIPLNSIK